MRARAFMPSQTFSGHLSGHFKHSRAARILSPISHSGDPMVRALSDSSYRPRRCPETTSRPAEILKPYQRATQQCVRYWMGNRRALIAAERTWFGGLECRRPTSAAGRETLPWRLAARYASARTMNLSRRPVPKAARVVASSGSGAGAKFCTSLNVPGRVSLAACGRSTAGELSQGPEGGGHVDARSQPAHF